MGHFGVSYLEGLILSELDIDCSARRSLALMYVRTAQFLFLLSLFQKELSFGRLAASLAAWLGPWVSSLVVLVGSCHVRSGVIRLGLRHLVGNSRVGLRLDHWKPVTTSV